jgi:flagellar hook-basal body complex protein FliE
MANLDIENLSRMVQTGDAEGLMGQSSASELRTTREARTNGLEIGPQAETGSVTFSDVLRKSVDTVNQMQTQANTAINELVAGRNKNIHETMLTIERADDALKLMMSVRNKILDAYREVMRMQV